MQHQLKQLSPSVRILEAKRFYLIYISCHKQETTATYIYIYIYIYILHISYGGTRWRSWLRHCATSRKVAGSIPNGVIGIFHWHPSGRTMALGLTQPLIELSTRNVSWESKGGRCIRQTTLPRLWADCLAVWEPQPPGTLRAFPGL